MGGRTGRIGYYHLSGNTFAGDAAEIAFLEPPLMWEPCREIGVFLTLSPFR